MRELINIKRNQKEVYILSTQLIDRWQELGYTHCLNTDNYLHFRIYVDVINNKNELYTNIDTEIIFNKKSLSYLKRGDPITLDEHNLIVETIDALKVA